MSGLELCSAYSMCDLIKKLTLYFSQPLLGFEWIRTIESIETGIEQLNPPISQLPSSSDASGTAYSTQPSHAT